MGNYFTDLAITDPVIASTFNDRFDELDAAIYRALGSGASFPGSPAEGDRFYRTDLNMMFGYNGAAWEAIQVYEKIWLPAMGFYIASGTPAQGVLGGAGLNGFPTWRLDAAADERVGTAILYQGRLSGTTLAANVYWAMDSATSGNVILRVGTSSFGDGEDTGAAINSTTQTVAVPATARVAKLTSFSRSQTFSSGKLIVVRFERTASDAGDTAANDLHFMGMEIVLS